MNFGGPVWHASARSEDEPIAWALAERLLRGVGDRSLGEWPQAGHAGTVHIRRRLAEWEADKYSVTVRDIRGSAEEELRLHKLFLDAPHLRAAFALLR